MGLPTSMMKWVRGKSSPLSLYAQGEGQPHVNGRGDSLVALALPELAEIVRHGRSFGVVESSAAAPVAALPTTTAQLTLWNGEPDGGLSYAIDSVFATVVVSAAAATSIGLAAMINKGRQTKPTSDLTPFSLSGKAGYVGAAVVDIGATVVNDGWHPLGNSITGPADQIGLTLEIPVRGLYVVPPGGMFSIAVLANTASTITVKRGFRWHEVALDLG